eukprot:5370041-Pyramimonas_sp.AAC.1
MATRAKGKRRDIRAQYVVNCAGLFSDKVAQMVGDRSFKVRASSDGSDGLGATSDGADGVGATKNS